MADDGVGGNTLTNPYGNPSGELTIVFSASGVEESLVKLRRIDVELMKAERERARLDKENEKWQRKINKAVDGGVAAVMAFSMSITSTMGMMDIAKEGIGGWLETALTTYIARNLEWAKSMSDQDIGSILAGGLLGGAASALKQAADDIEEYVWGEDDDVIISGESDIPENVVHITTSFDTMAQLQKNYENVQTAIKNAQGGFGRVVWDGEVKIVSLQELTTLKNEIATQINLFPLRQVNAKLVWMERSYQELDTQFKNMLTEGIRHYTGIEEMFQKTGDYQYTVGAEEVKEEMWAAATNMLWERLESIRTKYLSGYSALAIQQELTEWGFDIPVGALPDLDEQGFSTAVSNAANWALSQAKLTYNYGSSGSDSG